jgi:sulfur carrier protein ThiS
MRVTFKLYAMLSDHLPEAARKTNALDLDVPPGRTVGQVIDEFNLPPKLVHLVLVNGNYIPPPERAGWALAEGDVLAVWPPIAGG